LYGKGINILKIDSKYQYFYSFLTLFIKSSLRGQAFLYISGHKV